MANPDRLEKDLGLGTIFEAGIFGPTEVDLVVNNPNFKSSRDVVSKILKHPLIRGLAGIGAFAAATQIPQALFEPQKVIAQIEEAEEELPTGTPDLASIRLTLDDSFNAEELTGGVFASDGTCPGGWPVKAGIDASGQSVYYSPTVADYGLVLSALCFKFELGAKFTGFTLAGESPQRTVILRDFFDDPAVGWFPTSAREPNKYRQGYVGGEYQFLKIDLAQPSAGDVFLDGTYENVSFELDVRTVSGNNASFSTSCRTTNEGSYILTISTEDRHYALRRRDGTTLSELSRPQLTEALRRGEWNHIEMTCEGPFIGVKINGTTLAVVQDDIYSTGGLHFSVGSFPGSPADVRIDNLIVTQR